MQKPIGSRCLLFLSFCVALFSAAPQLYALGHYGIPGTVDGCDVCHDFAGGYYDNPALGNLRWVRSSIEWPAGTIHSPVKFTAFSSGLPADGTLADGDDAKLDGACEVCHPDTMSYHTNLGDGTNHFDAYNCTSCHPHFAGDLINYFEPRFVGTQSHLTHFEDPKGPMLGPDPCTICHNSTDFSRFADGEPLATTTVCDPCHSAGGALDGVNDSAVGAKPNWENGIYKQNGETLKLGKESWCATCHDNGDSAVDGVQAPNVMGDNSTYGYNVSGHGRNALNYVFCHDCHDLSVPHTDGLHRTYDATKTALRYTYQRAYRLNDTMAIPRHGEGAPTAFRLCTNCHIYTDITSRLTTNFRDDLKNTSYSYHQNHLEWYSGLPAWDSDWDGSGTYLGYGDSEMSCPACHNVHGSPSPVMIRHGELISTPGTTDKVPALDFAWHEQNATGGVGVTTTALEDSRYGLMTCNIIGNPAGPINGVCQGCHPPGSPDPNRIRYYRSPGGPDDITIGNVWTTDLSDTLKTSFAVGEAIRYHVSFDISGSGTFFVNSPGTKSQAFNRNGATWLTKLPKQGNLGAGSHEWTWDKIIPATATRGSNARVKILLKLFHFQGGTVLDSDTKTADFSIAP